MAARRTLIYIDDVFHEIMPGRTLSPSDHNADGLANRDDLAFRRHAFNSDAGGDADNDGDTDGADFLTCSAPWELLPPLFQRPSLRPSQRRRYLRLH